MKRIKRWFTAPPKCIRIPLAEYDRLMNLSRSAETFFMIQTEPHHWVAVPAELKNGEWVAESPVAGTLRYILGDFNGTLKLASPYMSTGCILPDDSIHIKVNVSEGR